MEVQTIELSKIKPTQNYRKMDDQDDVSTLMASIKRNGLLQPVVVKKNGSKFELLAGNRRFTAVKKLGSKTIDAVIRPGRESKRVINLIENIQRKNPSSYEVGRGLWEIHTKEGLTLPEISVRVGFTIGQMNRFIALFKEIPAPYRHAVRNTKRNTKPVGVISNAIADKIIALKKRGFIKTAQVNKLFEIVKKDNKITADQIPSLALRVKSGKKITDKAKTAVKTMTVRLMVSGGCYRKLIKEYGNAQKIHVAMKKELKKKFKLSFT